MSEMIVTLDTRELDRIAAHFQKDIEDIIIAVAFEVEREAKKNCPVLTGALKNSIYTRTRKSGGGFSASMIKGFAKIVRKNAGVGSRNVTELPEPQGDEIAVVGPTVDYGFWVEFGHDIKTKDGKRHIAGRPYLGPATEHWRQKINSGDMFRSLFK